MCMRRPTERLPTTSARPTATRPRSCPRMTAQWRASGLLRCPEKPGGGLVTICWRGGSPCASQRLHSHPPLAPSLNAKLVRSARPSHVQAMRASSPRCCSAGRHVVDKRTRRQALYTVQVALKSLGQPQLAERERLGDCRPAVCARVCSSLKTLASVPYAENKHRASCSRERRTHTHSGANQGLQRPTARLVSLIAEAQ